MQEIIEFVFTLLAWDISGQVECAWVGAAISAAAAIGSSIFGSISAKKQRDEQLAELRRQKEENRAWYNRRYNEDATQRADAQRLLHRANEIAKRRTQAAMGRKAVIGGTDASVAAVQQANADALGNAVSEIAAMNEARKNTIEDQYLSRQQNIDAQATGINSNYEASKRENIANAASGVLNAVGNYADSGSSSTTSSNTNTPSSTSFSDIPSKKQTAIETGQQLAAARAAVASKGSVGTSAKKIKEETDDFLSKVKW